MQVHVTYCFDVAYIHRQTKNSRQRAQSARPGPYASEPLPTTRPLLRSGRHFSAECDLAVPYTRQRAEEGGGCRVVAHREENCDDTMGKVARIFRAPDGRVRFGAVHPLRAVPGPDSDGRSC